MSAEMDDLAELVFQGFRESPFLRMTRRDAESIAMTVIAAGYVPAAEREAAAWERGHFYCAAEEGDDRCANPFLPDDRETEYVECSCGHYWTDHDNGVCGWAGCGCGA